MLPLSPKDRATWSRSPMAQAISDTLHADECADWIARDALRRDLSRPVTRHRALPRIAWAITVAVVVLVVAEVVELVGGGL